MQPSSDFLATSVASSLLTRFARTHERRGITVVAGHPGVGKSRTIRRFRELNNRRVAVISLGEGPKGGHTATQALSFALRAVGNSIGFTTTGRTSDHLMLRDMLIEQLQHWALPSDVEGPTRTIVFDEAQHLSRSGIEALRGLNDTPDEGGFAPFKVGLIFVGNQEFALKARGNSPSVLTQAVSDRVHYSVTLDYTDVTDGDLELYLDSKLNFETGAMHLALRYFRAGSASRSFRSADRLVERLRAEVGQSPVTATTMRHVLAIV